MSLILQALEEARDAEKLLASPPPAASPASPSGDVPLTIDALAQEIRRVDGNHSLGAGALAEAILPFITRAISSQSERIAVLEAALRPFAKAAEHDIGSTETDADIFQQMGQYNRAPKITVGDMRRARSALAPLGEE